MVTAPRVAQYNIDAGLRPTGELEGPRMISAFVPLVGGEQYVLNLGNEIDREWISNCQTIKIDNADGANPVTIKSSKTGDRIVIPQNTIAIVPFNIGDDTIFYIERADSGTLALEFINMPQPAIVWSSVSSGAIVSISGGVITSITDPVDVVIDDSTPIEVNVQQPVAVTVADGADVTQGALADAVEVNPANPASVIALLKGILTQGLAIVAALAGTLLVRQVSATGALTQVAGTGASVTVLAANAARKGAAFMNNSGVTWSLRLEAAAASAANASVTILNGQYYELPYGYTGEIRGIGASGNLTVTELT